MSDLLQAQTRPAQLIYSLDIFECQWHARQTNWRGSETTQLNQDLLQERSQGDHRSCCARTGSIWHRVLLSIHAYQFQVIDFDSTIRYAKGQWSIAVSLLGHCFQDIDLTKWTNVIAKWCTNNADFTKSNFNKCIRDYLKAVASFPNMS